MKCTYCDKQNENGRIYCIVCNSKLPFSKKDAPIKKSSCCNADITYSKGSYLGTFDETCARCGKYNQNIEN